MGLDPISRESPQETDLYVRLCLVKRKAAGYFLHCFSVTENISDIDNRDNVYFKTKLSFL